MSKHIDIGLLRSLAATGSFRTEIGTRLGVHSTTAARVARENGISIRVAPGPHDDQAEWWAERIDQALAMRAEGISYSEIARTIGTTKNALIGKMHRLGKCEAGGVTRDSEFWLRHGDEMLRLRAAGWSHSRIAQRLGTSRGCIYSRCRTVEGRAAKAPRPNIEFPPAGHCLMPSGDVPNMTFCGAPREDSTRSYCDRHHALCYLPPKPADMRAPE